MRFFKLFYQKLLSNKADAVAWCSLLALILASSLIEFKGAIFITFVQILIAFGGFLVLREFAEKKKFTLKVALRFSYVLCCFVFFLIFWGAK